MLWLRQKDHAFLCVRVGGGRDGLCGGDAAQMGAARGGCKSGTASPREGEGMRA
jgi:hypothetical protein